MNHKQKEIRFIFNEDEFTIDEAKQCFDQLWERVMKPVCEKPSLPYAGVDQEANILLTAQSLELKKSGRFTLLMAIKSDILKGYSKADKE